MASYVCLPEPRTGALLPALSVAPMMAGAAAQVWMNLRLEVLMGGSILRANRRYLPPQISPTVKPSGNGSSGSTTYCAKPVIHACPESVGTTARYDPTQIGRAH